LRMRLRGPRGRPIFSRSVSVKSGRTSASIWRCHGASGLRSHWRLGSQGDEENQLHRAPVSA
jgi:hypothetical protein